MLIDFETCLSRLQRMLVEICMDWETGLINPMLESGLDRLIKEFHS